jgi:hypothetical protein
MMRMLPGHASSCKQAAVFRKSASFGEECAALPWIDSAATRLYLAREANFLDNQRQSLTRAA